MRIVEHSIVDQGQSHTDDEVGVWCHTTDMGPGGFNTDTSHGLYQGAYGQVLKHLKINKKFGADDYLVKVPIHKVDT